MLNFGWMLKATVNNGLEQLWLEQEALKARAMDGDIGALNILLVRCLSPVSPPLLSLPHHLHSPRAHCPLHSLP